ncbi:unnamed protein product [Ixodes hexagonus]
MLRQDTVMKTAITMKKREAISLYRLCSTAEERTIAHLFAVGQSVVNGSYREFYNVIIEKLESRTVSIVRSGDLDNHILEFEAVLGFPNAIGALDGYHLPVSPPKDSAVDYRNYEGWYSIILLALVDHRYLFSVRERWLPWKVPRRQRVWAFFIGTSPRELQSSRAKNHQRHRDPAPRPV